MTEPNFWLSAMATPPEPEPEPDFTDMPMAEFIARRQASGHVTSDFVGVEGWSREKAVRNIPREETAMERWAEERKALGIPDAPTSSAAKHLRETRGAWNAVNDNNPRNRRNK